MSERRVKTERKRAAVKKVEPQVFFEDVLLAFLRNVGQVAGGIKGRGGAQTLGPVAMSICATEALDVARSSGDAPKSIREYISASAYALAAAMQQGGVWNLPPKPAPTSEQAPEPQEKPSAPPESKGKGKSKGRGKQWT